MSMPGGSVRRPLVAYDVDNAPAPRAAARAFPASTSWSRAAMRPSRAATSRFWRQGGVFVRRGHGSPRPMEALSEVESRTRAATSWSRGAVSWWRADRCPTARAERCAKRRSDGRRRTSSGRSKPCRVQLQAVRASRAATPRFRSAMRRYRETRRPSRDDVRRVHAGHAISLIGERCFRAATRAFRWDIRAFVGAVHSSPAVRSSSRATVRRALRPQCRCEIADRSFHRAMSRFAERCGVHLRRCAGHERRCSVSCGGVVVPFSCVVVRSAGVVVSVGSVRVSNAMAWSRAVMPQSRAAMPGTRAAMPRSRSTVTRSCAEVSASRLTTGLRM